MCCLRVACGVLRVACYVLCVVRAETVETVETVEYYLDYFEVLFQYSSIIFVVLPIF